MSDTATEVTADVTAAPVETSPELTTDTDPWDFVQSQANDIPDTWEEFDAMEARRRGEDQDAVTPETPEAIPDLTTPQAEAEPAAVDVQPVATTPAELPAEAQEQIQAFAELDRAIKEDPAAVAAAIFEGMDARQKAAFIKDTVGEIAPRQYSDFKVDEYDATETSAMEQALKERWKDIEAIPHAIADTRKLDSRISEVQGMIENIPNTLNPQVAYANVISEINSAKIDAICEALGIDLPDPDFKAIEQALSEKGIKYRDGVRKVVNYGTAIELHKQKGASRPKTPGNESKAKSEGIPDSIGSDPVKLARWINARR